MQILKRRDIKARICESNNPLKCQHNCSIFKDRFQVERNTGVMNFTSVVLLSEKIGK